MQILQFVLVQPHLFSYEDGFTEHLSLLLAW